VTEFEFTDRYKALGIPYPDPKTVCLGYCEGTGWVPISEDVQEPKFRKLWLEAERKKPSDDGWHFVKCPDCRGTGRRFGADAPINPPDPDRQAKP
jgi:hypothetical protein